MSDPQATYSAFAAERGLEPVPALGLGALTPLLVESKHCQVSRRELMPVFIANRMDTGLTLPAYANPQDPDEFILVW